MAETLLIGSIALCACFETGTRLVSLPPSLFEPAAATTSLVDVQGKTLAILGTSSVRISEPEALSAVGRWLPEMTVSLEDHRFYEHKGVDWRAVGAAAWRNLKAGRVVSGGSTITQQLIKITEGRTGRAWGGKLYESMAAVKLERTWSKERILQEYLNRIDYGNRRYGPVAAARVYFNKLPASLSRSEAIYLAGLPQAPTRLNPFRHPQQAEAKFHRSVDRLFALRKLDSKDRPLFASPPSVKSYVAPVRLGAHFVDAIRTEYPKLDPGVVETTLDLELQTYVEQRTQAHLLTLAAQGATQAAVVIMDTRTGAIRAMVGSRNYEGRDGGQINGTLAYHSAGSTLKPFLYLHAIDTGLLTAASLLPDTPDAIRSEYADYDPTNYDKRYWGPVRVREALASSLNVPAVVTLSRLGARKTFHTLQDFGFKFDREFDEFGAGMILGNADIRLLDLTAAFTVFAGHDLAVTPRYIAQSPARHRHLTSSGAVAIVGDILSDNDARRKAFGAFSPLAFENARIPCKTGTSSGFRDVWTVGVTSEHAVGVWIGNFNGRGMREAAAISSAAPLWRELVDHLLRVGDHSVPPPTEEEGLVKMKVCKLTGLLPGVTTAESIDEWFLPGSEPMASADSLFSTVNGTKRLMLPPEYALWCRSPLNYLGARVRMDDRLRILSPRQNSIFVFDPTLPASQQAIPLVANMQNVRWFVDDCAVKPNGDLTLWPLQEGRHTMRAATISESLVQEFTVSAPPSLALTSTLPAKEASVEIDLTEQTATLLINGRRLRKFPISSGRIDHPTPTGDFKVINKSEVHFSSLYGRLVSGTGVVLDEDADGFTPLEKGERFVSTKMRYFMEFDHGNGIHAGPLPGYPASHGCVRVSTANAQLCFEHLQIGSAIRITGQGPSSGDRPSLINYRAAHRKSF